MGLDIHTLLFILYCGKDGLWRARANVLARHSVFAGRVRDKCPLPHSYFQLILAAFFVTIVTVKIESIPDFYTWAIVLIN